VGVDVATPQQKLDVAGAIRIGTTASNLAGTIRYNGTTFEGHNGSIWVPFAPVAETDPVYLASPAGGITTGNISNWNTAYGWGNHASAGYLTTLNGLSSPSQTFGIGASGTAPAFVSSGSLHTLNIPFAATSGVTAGLLSYAQYSALLAGLMPSGLTNQTLRHNGTNWIASGLLINDGNNIGIGVPAPSERLHVSGNARFAGFINSEIGFRISNAAASGRFLRGDGTNFVSSTIQATDIPAGNVNYIQNQNAAAQAASNYWISGDGNIEGLLDFRTNNRQMINLYGGGTYGIGVQPVTSYFRTAQNFAWYRGGVHTNTTFDPGAGGTALMALTSTGNLGINTTDPQQKLHVIGTARISALAGGTTKPIFADVNGDLTSTAPTSGALGFWTRSGSNLYNSTLGDNVGIGVSVPSRKLDVDGAIRLSYGHQIYLGENVSANGKIGINFHTDADPNYWIGKPAGAWTQPLHVAFYTGIRIGANSTYGGTRFYNSSDMNTQLMSVGDGDNHVRVNNYLFAQYLNSTDNSVATGVTGIMVKAGDNYFRTGTAASVLSFLGVTAPTGDNLGNHTATTTLNMNSQSISNVSDIYAVQNYGRGLVGLYSDVRYQNVFAMGTLYRLAADGSTPGNLYGLAWTHSNIGGQSRPGLGHQLLAMSNGLTTAAMGNGFWTNHGIETGANGTYNRFRTWTDLTGYHGLYSSVHNGAHLYPNNGTYGAWKMDGSRNTWVGLEFGGSQQNNTLMMGTTGQSWGGQSTGIHNNSYGWLWRFDHQTLYAARMIDMDNGGYYMDPNSTSRMYYGDYNYLHTQVNDSWFPYTGNNWNYFRGNSYITNAHWYDENNTGYYFNVDNTSRMAYIYQGVGANNVGGWISGRIQTESTSDGHQYHPLTGNWGYVGTSGQYWFYIYSNNYIDVSRRETKRNIIPVEGDLSELLMSDLDNIKPSFYKYKLETDELEEGNEPKYRPNMHLGVILDESPDYLQDQAFSGIDIYAIATLGVAAAKHNREEIKNLKNGVGLTRINDFGSIQMSGESFWVTFDPSFSNQLTNGEVPVITLTAGALGKDIAVVDKSNIGFRIVKQGSEALAVDWMAMAKVSADTETTPLKVPKDLMSQLRVDESRKAPIKAYWEEHKRIGQEEHARQTIEHQQVVEQGTRAYMKTENPESEEAKKVLTPVEVPLLPHVPPADAAKSQKQPTETAPPPSMRPQE